MIRHYAFVVLCLFCAAAFCGEGEEGFQDIPAAQLNGGILKLTDAGATITRPEGSWAWAQKQGREGMGYYCVNTEGRGVFAVIQLAKPPDFENGLDERFMEYFVKYMKSYRGRSGMKIEINGSHDSTYPIAGKSKKLDAKIVLPSGEKFVTPYFLIDVGDTVTMLFRISTEVDADAVFENFVRSFRKE